MKRTGESISQETVFIEKEADSWFERNAQSILEPAKANHPIIQALKQLPINHPFTLIDLGGGSGKVSAGIMEVMPNCKATVVEPSAKAVRAGKETFPVIKFIQGSLTQATDMPACTFDIALVCGVFTWIDRLLLSQAVANVDRLVKPGGYLAISDFETPYPRANPYHHHPGLFTYKQDYSLPFLALNLYTEVYHKAESLEAHSSSNSNDPYDTWWGTTILQKDIQGRYQGQTKPLLE